MENSIKKVDLNFIRYSNCWEDPLVLLKSLNINENSKCFSIASAGDNTLALLTKSPESILAVDVNKAQIACLEIKIAAIKNLTHLESLEFLGFSKPTNDRLNIYESIKKDLSTNSKIYWDTNKNIITSGIIYCGKFENYFKIFHKYILPMIHNRKTVSKLLEEKSQDERINFYDITWNSTRWKLLFKIFFSKISMGKLGRDPEFFKYVEGKVADNILKRTEYAFTILPTHNNPFLEYIMTGNFKNNLPYYIQEDNYCIIKKNLNKITLFNGTVEEALKEYSINYNTYNLSDIFEYMDEKEFKHLSEKILAKSSEKTRYAYWNMLVDRKISDIFPEKVTCLNDLSDELFKKDQAFFYKALYIEEKKQ